MKLARKGAVIAPGDFQGPVRRFDGRPRSLLQTRASCRVTAGAIASKEKVMNRTTAFLAAFAALAAAAPLRANDQDVRGTTVPASACQPASMASAEKLQLSNAAWIFASGVTGTAY